ncbi:MAG: hypothetical protein RLY43_2456 [Bacteroidota bacterium]|jgi:hypothetical protein
MIKVIRFKQLSDNEVYVHSFDKITDEVESQISAWKGAGYSVIVSEKKSEGKNFEVWALKPNGVYGFFKWFFVNILLLWLAGALLLYWIIS